MPVALSTADAFDRAAGPVLEDLRAGRIDAILNLLPDAALVDRTDDLSAKANGGELTEAERDELTAYLDADTLISLLQAHAGRRRRVSAAA